MKILAVFHPWKQGMKRPPKAPGSGSGNPQNTPAHPLNPRHPALPCPASGFQPSGRQVDRRVFGAAEFFTGRFVACRGFDTFAAKLL
jgi:hypothetical protein